ncbi:hypothetical protein [Planomonospora parontospora]|uniref:hypothetical protein n=1 Tax=Planomonospora parontospora TaxID=58119 RepID=UPI0016717635|nr:hypothetical protein [Planomonospora parontospora]GGL48054.1 hypothetical protein GCM10014719_56650 [Planomonospora parontospora subsp. antibiotica]GII18793.1 hypothetical protein Ppa05_55190 [Planomonospora parontospora subsp. antibiotica]
MIRIKHDLPAGTRVIEEPPFEGVGLMLSTAGYEWDYRTNEWIQPDTAYLPADTKAIEEVVRLLTKAGFTTTVEIADWIAPTEEARSSAARHVGPTGPAGRYLVTDLRPGDLIRYGDPHSTQTKWGRVGRINRRTADVYPHNMLWSRVRVTPTAVQEARRTTSPTQLANLAIHARIRFSAKIPA